MKWLLLVLVLPAAAANIPGLEIEYARVEDIGPTEFTIYEAESIAGSPDVSMDVGWCEPSQVRLEATQDPRRVSLVSGGLALRFSDPMNERSCAEARIQLTPSPGSQTAKLHFTSDRSVAGGALARPVFEQYIRLWPDEDANQTQEIEWYPMDAASLPMRETAAELTLPPGDTVVLAFGYAEVVDPANTDQLGAHAEGVSLSSDLLRISMHYMFQEVPMQEESERLLGSRDGALSYLAKVEFEITEDAYQHQVQLGLDNDYGILELRGPQGVVDNRFLQTQEVGGRINVTLTPQLFEENGYGQYTMSFSRTAPIENASRMTLLMGLLFIGPVVAGIFAQRNVYGFDLATRGSQRSNYWLMQATLTIAWLGLIGTIFAIIFGGYLPLMVSLPLQPVALVLYAVLLGATAIFIVAMPAAKRGELTNVQRQLGERQLMESRLQRSNEDLAQFASVASHDMREPLRMVASFSDLLHKKYTGELDEQADRYLEYINDGAKRLDELLDGLLAYGRVDQEDPHFRALDLQTVMGQVERDLTVLLQETNGTIQWQKLPVVYGVPSQISQLLQNLVANALRYRGEADPVVRIWATRDAAAWRISVTDNGMGIDEKHADLVFQIFHKLDRKRRGGTGLGLAVCKRIVQRHGGEIGVQSKLGEGATFWFTVPDDLQAPKG